MKKKIMGALPFLAVPAVLNYVVTPLILFLAPADAGMLLMMALLLALHPMAALWTGFLYGARRGFWWLYPVAVAALFVPCIFLFYNETAWVYPGVYFVIALIGLLFGHVLGRK